MLHCQRVTKNWLRTCTVGIIIITVPSTSAIIHTNLQQSLQFNVMRSNSNQFYTASVLLLILTMSFDMEQSGCTQ